MGKLKHFYRIFFGVLIFVAIFYQLYYLRNSPTYNLINYVSYFTVLSNFFVASVLLLTGVRSGKTIHFDYARGAATLYILVTGFGFIFLLGGDNDQLLPWVNIVLHYLAPFIMLLDWFVDPLEEKISFSYALSWLAPPFVYLGFAFIRGYFINWYPYDFLDLNKTNIFDMSKYFLYVFIGMFISTLLLIKLSRVK